MGIISWPTVIVSGLVNKDTTAVMYFIQLGIPRNNSLFGPFSFSHKCTYSEICSYRVQISFLAAIVALWFGMEAEAEYWKQHNILNLLSRAWTVSVHTRCRQLSSQILAELFSFMNIFGVDSCRGTISQLFYVLPDL